MSRRPRCHRTGFFPDLSFEDYAAIEEAVNSSWLRSLRFGGRAAWHYRRLGTVVTPSMRAGSLAHIQILDPSQYLKRVALWDEPVLEQRPALVWDKRSPDYYVTSCGRYLLERTEGGDWRAGAAAGDYLIDTVGTVTAAKAACKEHYERTVPRVPKLDDDGKPKIAPQNPNSAPYKAFLAANPGREIVTQKEIDQAKRIALAVRDNPAANEVLTGIWDTEVSIVWKDPETGVLCKARIDWLTDPRAPRILLGDVKTCRDNAPPGFPQDAARREYYAQVAWYVTGLRECCRQVYGTDPKIRSVLLAVQSGGCNDSTVYDVEPEDLEAGDRLNADRLQQLLKYQDEYPDQPWPGQCQRAPLNLGKHASWVFGEDSNDMGGLDLSGVERRGEEN